MELYTVFSVSILGMIVVAGTLTYFLEPLGDPELNQSNKGDK